MLKKLVKGLFVIALCVLSLCFVTSCNNLPKITIIQYVSATALDNATTGIIEGLKANGYVDGENVNIVVQNPQAKADTLSQMVEKAISDSDLVFAIATPVAQSCIAELKKTGSDVPVIFTAVTDPVSAGILPESGNTYPIAGTSDMNPVADQIELATKLNKDAKKIGFIYTTGETNSEIQLDLAEKAAEKYGLTIEAKSCTNQTDLESVLNNLIGSGIDFLYIPTDNEIASQMKTVSEKCGLEKIITICGETGELVDGGIITCGAIDYIELGKMTGEMGAKALKGADVSKMEIGYYSGKDIVVNKELVAKYELDIPQEILDSASDIK